MPNQTLEEKEAEIELLKMALRDTVREAESYKLANSGLKLALELAEMNRKDLEAIITRLRVAIQSLSMMVRG